MSRYIDADKMIADLLTVDPQYETMIWWCCDVTNAQPTADVVEVRHGRWLRVGQSFIDPNKFLCFECSICRCTLDNHIKVEPNYCPNCGAKMDGEEQEHE